MSNEKRNYARVFKWILGIMVLIYSVLGVGVSYKVEYPLATILASIIGGLFAGSILGGVVVLIMWIATRLKAPKEPNRSDGSDG